MTALELFQRLAPLVAPALYAGFEKLNLCVLATRTVMDVAAYFDIAAEPWPVRAILTNEIFERHVEGGDWMAVDVKHWAGIDGSHSVGLGFPRERAAMRSFDATAEYPDGGLKARIQSGWAGHLIVRSGDCFGDFAVKQGERRDKGIVTGSAVIGPIGDGVCWCARHDCGTTLRYWRIEDHSYRQAPDWKDEKRRRKIVGALIRVVRQS